MSLIPLQAAADQLCIEPKRLLGFLMRNKLQDPIGGDTPEGIMVYEWSLADLRQRLANDSSVVQP